MKRKATVLWQGSLKQGHGEVSTQSGALKSVPYSFNTRFTETPGVLALLFYNSKLI